MRRKAHPIDEFGRRAQEFVANVASLHDPCRSIVTHADIAARQRDTEGYLAGRLSCLAERRLHLPMLVLKIRAVFANPACLPPALQRPDALGFLVRDVTRRLHLDRDFFSAVWLEAAGFSFGLAMWQESVK